jgi:2-(1,2-epoxy-1,2-dihydrophenyl)acetyl-CoA isomerase
MDYASIRVEKRDRAALITLNRPERLNAISREMADEILAALAAAGSDPEVWAVILTGAGRAFCSGADLSPRPPGDSPRSAFQARRGLREGLQRLPLALVQLEKPVIAAVNGIAAGGGMDLACACDIRVAGRSARFSEIFARRGLFPGTGGCYLLPRLVGLAKAAELIWSGDTIDADEALRIGLVSYVVDDEALIERAFRLAARVTQGAPIAVALAKSAMYRSQHSDFASALEYFATAETITLTSHDHEEGIRAFREKRPPRFEGR